MLGVCRLSRAADESTSIETQRRRIKELARFRGWTIVGWAIDDGVSAIKVGPFERPALGPWLADRGHEFDAIVCWKLDRLFRNSMDLIDTLRWCDQHTVDISCTDEEIDLSSSVGRLIAYVLVWAAEREGQSIKERTTSARKALLEMRRWHGGTPPYGYNAIPSATGGWYLAINTDQKDIVREVVRRVVSKESRRSIARDLSDRGVPRPAPPRKNTQYPDQWSDMTLANILRNPALLGQRRHKGELVRDTETGLPAQFAEPIVTWAEWQQLQTVLDDAAIPHNNHYGKAPLLGVAYCGVCQSIIYRTSAEKSLNYRCQRSKQKRGCDQLSVRAPQLETVVFSEFLNRVGNVEVVEKVFHAGEDHTEDLETARAAFNDLTTQLSITRSSSGRDRITQQLTALDGRIAALESLPVSEAGYVLEPTGETFSELFEGLDPEDRGALLRDAGVKAFFMWEEGRPGVALVLPDDLEAQAQAWSSGRVQNT